MEQQTIDSVTDFEWEDLQRQCHPFPAYVDYLHGHSTNPEISRQRWPGLQDSFQSSETDLRPSPFDTKRALPVAAPGYMVRPGRNISQMPNHATQSSRTELRVTRSHGLPPAQSDQSQVLPVDPSTKSLPVPGSQPPSQAHLLNPNQLLQPQYAWLGEDGRKAVNAKLIQLHNGMQNPNLTLLQRQNILNEITEISKRISTEHTRRLQVDAAKRNINTAMPRVWQALRIRSRLPPEHQAWQTAGHFLHKFMGSLNQEARSYVLDLLASMTVAEAEGRSPLAVMANAIAPENAGKLTSTGVGHAAATAAKPQASSSLKQESSPLPI